MRAGLQAIMDAFTGGGIVTLAVKFLTAGLAAYATIRRIRGTRSHRITAWSVNLSCTDGCIQGQFRVSTSMLRLKASKDGRKSTLSKPEGGSYGG